MTVVRPNHLRLSGPRTVVPGPTLPPTVVPAHSNNNLDVIDHDGRRWLAWRTAPTHFASPEARLEVVSSDDLGATWRSETTISLGRDVRQPRWFVMDGRLLLYAFEAGTDGHRFQPGRILLVERGPDGWSEPEFVSEPGCVVWRVRWIGGRAVMSVYLGADTIYTAHPEPVRVELWTSDDGRRWGPLDADRPVLHIGTETELVETGDGRVVYVCRKEGPQGGWGTDVGVAPVDDPLAVRWQSLPQKCDSPLLARHHTGLRLVTRRQVRFGGRFDLGWQRGQAMARTRAYQLLYSATPKRTGVFALDPDELSLTHLGDLPSRGDTAFASVVAADGRDPHTADRWTAYNYTSPVRGPDLPWFAGQLRPTEIVAVDLDP